MSNIDTSDVILAGLGIGGFLWMNRKLEIERRTQQIPGASQRTALISQQTSQRALCDPLRLDPIPSTRNAEQM